jgi:hypothetical protein
MRNALFALSVCRKSCFIDRKICRFNAKEKS